MIHTTDTRKISLAQIIHAESLFENLIEVNMSETNELAQKLARRNQINEGEDVPPKQMEVFNPYTEFKEFSRKQIKDFEKMFKK